MQYGGAPMINWPDYLVEDIARRKSVLFLGAGISKNSTSKSGDRPPDWKEFLQGALSKILGDTSYINSLITEKDYLTACEMIVNKLGYDFFEYAKEKFLRPGYASHDIHKAIFELDSRIVATPNVDKIYDTFANQESQSTIIVKNYYDDDLADLVRCQDRLIIKVHGTIDKPQGMIFTRKDYARARCNYSSFYNILSALTLTHTFIFLGCGLSDPDVRLLLENYTFIYPNCRPHYMATSEDNINDDFKKVIKENCNLELLSYSPDNNHQELLDSLKILVDEVEEVRTEIASTQTW